MLYKIAHVLVFVLAKLFFRLRILGRAHVPRSGGVIVAANHNSYLDIPLLGCALPRRAENIAKIELFRNRCFGAFIRMMGAIPVRRGARDHQALEEAVRRVKNGRLLVIYPEGTRSVDGALQRAKPGVGKIVAESEASVIPAFIQGTHNLAPFRRVTVSFGTPMSFQSELKKGMKEKVHPKILYATIASKIMSEIASLKAELDALQCPKSKDSR